MQPSPKRSELDHLAKSYALDRERVAAMLDLAGASPTRAERLGFLATALRIAGVLSLASALVFFVAANWSALAVFGRFLLVEAVLVACGVVAFVRPPPDSVGRGALFLAFVATGALLALFGQTYQTGADVYELFLTWTLLGLPLVALARWGVASAAWVLVLNTALMLYCGWQPGGGLLWTVFGGRFSTAGIMAVAAWVNLSLWFAAEWWRPGSVPAWVRRLIVTAACLFLAFAGVAAVTDRSYAGQGRDGGVFMLTLLSLGAVVIATLRRREDVYPLAVALAAFIFIVLFGLVEMLPRLDEGLFLVAALWLVGATTLGGKWLVSLMRRWRAEAGA